MEVDQTYLDQLNNNFDQGIKLAQKKIRKLGEKINACEQYISYLEKNLATSNTEVDRLKEECKAVKHELEKCRDHLELKEEALVVQDNRIIQLEDTIDNLKSRIRELSKSSNKSSEENMAVPDILANIGTALDRVENYINGDTSFDPRNTLNGIRISLTTIRGLTQRHVQDLINMQNLLNTANGRIANFMAEVANRRTNLLQTRHREQMMTQAWRDERQARQNANTEIDNLRDMICENVFEKCWWKRRYTACSQQAQNLKRHYRQSRADIGLLEYNRDRLNERYLKWKAKELNSRQIILNLQNNPPGNMATIQDVMHTLAPLLAQLPNYDGQEPPDVYYQKLRNINEMARPLAVAGFAPGARCQVMKNKMTGRFAPVPVNDPYAVGNPAIVTEPLFLNWLRERYREVMVGTNRSAIFALVNEKFLETDTPDSYEKRIKPLVQAMADADALPYLLNQLPPDLEMRVRIANPATIDAFFTELRNIWHESAGKRIHAPTLPPVNYTAQSQKDDFKIRLARDLAYNGIAMDDTTLEKFIYEELKKRLGATTAHIRKSPFTSRIGMATVTVINRS